MNTMINERTNEQAQGAGLRPVDADELARVEGGFRFGIKFGPGDPKHYLTFGAKNPTYKLNLPLC